MSCYNVSRYAAGHTFPPLAMSICLNPGWSNTSCFSEAFAYATLIHKGCNNTYSTDFVLTER